jgi:hypothetical protein
MRPFAWALSVALAIPVVVLDARAPTRGTPEAQASVAVLMSLEELVDHSRFVVVAEPMERYARWEELAGSRRIVTYTRLAVHESVIGEADQEVWVRTLGGVVDKIGQSVSGEARFTLGERALVFLGDMDGTLVVTGLAQGHYPVVEESGKPPRLKASPDTGKLVSRPGPTISAHERLVGATLSEAVSRTVEVRRARDAKK